MRHRTEFRRGKLIKIYLGNGPAAALATAMAAAAAAGAHAQGSRDAAEIKNIPRWLWAAGARSGRFAE